MLGTLVYYTLEILAGIITWTVVKSSQGIYYLVYGSGKKEEIQIPEGRIYDKEYIKKLIQENEELREKIKKQEEEQFVVVNLSDTPEKEDK